MKKGFTLLEVIVAISIFLIGIVGVYAVVPRIIAIGQVNVDRFIACQLGREGIEIVRNIRDSNYLEGAVSWNDGLTDCSGGCEIDYNDSGFTAYGDGRYLRINADGFYNYDPVSGINPETKFKRKIIITQPEGYILDVQVQVFWSQASSTVQEILYDWR